MPRAKGMEGTKLTQEAKDKISERAAERKKIKENMVQRTIVLPLDLKQKVEGIVERSDGNITFNDVIRAIISQIPDDFRLVLRPAKEDDM